MHKILDDTKDHQQSIAEEHSDESITFSDFNFQ